MANKPIYKIGEYLKHRQSGQPYVITHIDRNYNRKGVWYLYTAQRLGSEPYTDNFCLRAGQLKKIFDRNPVAHVLYSKVVTKG